MGATAREVSEYLLRLTARALMTRDFDSFSGAFALPQLIRTSTSEVVLTRREDLRKMFDALCDHFEANNVTYLGRRCVAADFRTPDRVEATHVSSVLAGDREVSPPYPVFSVLERIEGNWQIISSEYAIDDETPHGKVMLTCKDADRRALDIYQRHLDEQSDALLTDDFESFERSICLPHHITTQTEHFAIRDRAHLIKTFRGFSTLYSDRGLTALVRIVKSAAFSGPDEIIGTHETHQMRAHIRITPPYPNRVRLVRDGNGLWRETHCAQGILNTSQNFNTWTQVADRPYLPEFHLTSER